jgi:hypothetical protein
MNADSRQAGKGAKAPKAKGKRRTVTGLASTVPKLAPTPEEPSKPASTKLDRAAIVGAALDELAAAAIEAARNIGRSARLDPNKRRERGSQQQSADAKWLLEQLMNRVELTADVGSGATESEQPGVSQVDELAARRTALRNALRSHRRDMNK